MKPYFLSTTLSLSAFIVISLFMPRSVHSQENSNVTTGEIRRGVLRTAQDSTAGWNDRFRERIVKQLEPSGKPKPEKISEYLDKYKDIAVYDPRVICFDVQGKDDKGKIILTGMVSFQEEKLGLLNALDALKFTNIEDRIEVLPDPQLGEKRYALAIVAHVPYFSRPSGMQEKLTESMYGDGIFLMKEDNVHGYYFAQNASGYMGWIHKEDVLPVTLNDFREWRSKKRALFRKTYENVSTDFMIPLGAEMRLDSLGNIVLPTGETMSIPSHYYVTYSLEAIPKVDQLINSAHEYLQTGYVWGGVTKDGIDCSGFVQSLYRAYGINLARDADQQYIAGEIVGWRGFTEDLLPGDLLYFIGGNGRISHTGIYIGGQKFMHAQEPKVHFSSFRPGDPDYDYKTISKFVTAKRIFRGE